MDDRTNEFEGNLKHRHVAITRTYAGRVTGAVASGALLGWLKPIYENGLAADHTDAVL